MWEIAELKKPHSDLGQNPIEIADGIRKRMREKYYEPFSNNIPGEWQSAVYNGEFSQYIKYTYIVHLFICCHILISCQKYLLFSHGLRTRVAF